MSDVYAIQSPALKKRLLAVMDEDQADAALAVLEPELAAWAEYENAATWQTDCLSCANMLSSCIKETVRAETAEKELADYEENVVGDMNEKAIAAARRIAELETQVTELRADLENLEKTEDENLAEALDVMRRFKEAYEQSEQQRQNALAEREEWRQRALARRGAIHEIRAELKRRADTCTCNGGKK
jgi:chromosome segregation ATPase